jgi:hypothetical protein
MTNGAYECECVCECVCESVCVCAAVECAAFQATRDAQIVCVGARVFVSGDRRIVGLKGNMYITHRDTDRFESPSTPTLLHINPTTSILFVRFLTFNPHPLTLHKTPKYNPFKSKLIPRAIHNHGQPTFHPRRK